MLISPCSSLQRSGEVAKRVKLDYSLGHHILAYHTSLLI